MKHHAPTIAEAIGKIPPGIRVLGIIIIIGLTILACRRGGHVNRTSERPSDGAGGMIIAVGIACAIAGWIYSKKHHPAATPPPRIITHVITHTSVHPLISGWQVVVLVCVVAGIVLSAWINRR